MEPRASRTSHRGRRRTVGAIASALTLMIVAACGSTSVSPSASAIPSPTATAEPSPVSIEDLAHAVVQIVLFVDGAPESLGSGTIISPDGLILTNSHVITPEGGVLDHLEIGITEAADAAPEPTYLAEVAAADGALDLAVLRITERIDGAEVSEDFPYVELGDSDALHIGDDLTILGYPGIGGETITLTSGRVSGFVSEAGLGQRAWVKTDATIAGGNSGGLAANEDGELIAVPTIAAASDEVVDCRPVRDTNRDGTIDDADDCVPIGGFLNGLRPIVLAREMIDAVRNGVAYEPIAEPETPSEPGDVEGVLWDDPVFGMDVTADDEPVGEALAFGVGTTSICAFWEYEGMRPEMRWSAEWSVDGTLNESGSFFNEQWSLDASGSFWVCLDDEAGLEAGVYDIALSVEEQVVSTGFVVVADDLDTTAVTFSNDSAQTICYLFASPRSATVWGPERIGRTDVLDPGERLTFELAAAEYDLHAETCDESVIFDEVVGVSAGGTLALSWSGTGLSSDGGSSSGTADLAIGDCVDGEIGWTRENTNVVDCASAHVYEIVGLLSAPSSDGSFPGDETLRQLAEDRCYDAFEAYVGIAYADSIWYMTHWAPSTQTWAAGDRTVVCTLHEENLEPVTGSRRGAAE